MSASDSSNGLVRGPSRPTWPPPWLAIPRETVPPSPAEEQSSISSLSEAKPEGTRGASELAAPKPDADRAAANRATPETPRRPNRVIWYDGETGRSVEGDGRFPPRGATMWTVFGGDRWHSITPDELEE